jgi:hypothetical protein
VTHHSGCGADIKFSGDLSPRLRWRITFDVSKSRPSNKTVSKIGDSLAVSDVSVDQRSRIVQDAALTYAVGKRFPRHRAADHPDQPEGTIATAKVETIERTMFIVELHGRLARRFEISVSRERARWASWSITSACSTRRGRRGTGGRQRPEGRHGRVAAHPPYFRIFSSVGRAFEGGPLKQRRERAGGEIQYMDSRLAWD